MFTLSKTERLSSKTLFNELFGSGLSFVKYPFRIIYKKSSLPGEYPARIAISVSKKKFKRAVKRNRIKRLTREAFRLNKTSLYTSIPSGTTIDILLIYLDNTLPTFEKIEKALKSSIQKINIELSDNQKAE